MSKNLSNRTAGKLRRATSSARPDAQPQETDEKPQKGIASVETAATILKALDNATTQIALKDVAEASGLTTAATHHYLVSLVRTGLVRQDRHSGRYGLGPYALQLGLSALGQLDITEIGAEALLQVRDETGESCFMAVWGSHGATIIKYFEGSHAVAVEARLGLVMPLLSSATGSVFLAWKSPTSLKAVLEQELRHNPLSTQTIQNMQKEVIERGVGVTRGGLLPRIAAVAAPVFDHENRLAFVLTALGWNDEFDTESSGRIAQVLREKSRQASLQLGHRPS